MSPISASTTGFRAIKLHAWGDPKKDAQAGAGFAHARRPGYRADVRRLGGVRSGRRDLCRPGAGGGRVLLVRGADARVQYRCLSALGGTRSISRCSRARRATARISTSPISSRTMPAIWCAPSTHYKGGITGAMRIAHLAQSFNMRAEVHGGGMANLAIWPARFRIRPGTNRWCNRIRSTSSRGSGGMGASRRRMCRGLAGGFIRKGIIRAWHRMDVGGSAAHIHD